MSPAAQIVLAVGAAGLLLMTGCIGVIWAIRCDPARPHYRLPSLGLALAPLSAAIAAWLRSR